MRDPEAGARLLIPGKLWSLWGIMRDFEGYRFIALASMLGELMTNHPQSNVVIGDDWKKAQLEPLRSYYGVLTNLGMDASQSSLERLVAKIEQDGTTFSDLSDLAAELKGRLQDQAEKRAIFGLSIKEGEYASNPRAGWQTAIERFPDIVQDVDEAAYCLALSRYPASVYHSVQVTEFGLMELGKFLKVNDPHSGWTAVANALEKVIQKKYADRTTFERKNFESLEQIQGTVQALKNAWRNKISHVQGRLILLRTDFGFERSEEILTATRAFMRRLAEDLPPPRARKPKLSDINDLEYLDPRDELGLGPDEPLPETPRRSRPKKAPARSQ